MMNTNYNNEAPKDDNLKQFHQAPMIERIRNANLFKKFSLRKRIASVIKQETSALELVKNTQLHNELGNLEIVSLANSFLTVCLHIINTPNLAEQLSGQNLRNLIEHYRFKNEGYKVSVEIDNIPSLSSRVNIFDISSMLFTYKTSIDIDILITIINDAQLLASEIRKLAKTNSTLATAIIKNRELRSIVLKGETSPEDSFFEDVNMVCKHEKSALELINQPHLRQYWPVFCVEQLANSFASVCLAILHKPELAQLFSGQQLLSLYQKYDLDVQHKILHTESLQLRLDAYKFFCNIISQTNYMSLLIKTIDRAKLSSIEIRELAETNNDLALAILTNRELREIVLKGEGSSELSAICDIFMASRHEICALELIKQISLHQSFDSYHVNHLSSSYVSVFLTILNQPKLAQFLTGEQLLILFKKYKKASYIISKLIINNDALHHKLQAHIQSVSSEHIQIDSQLKSGLLGEKEFQLAELYQYALFKKYKKASYIISKLIINNDPLHHKLQTHLQSVSSEHIQIDLQLKSGLPGEKEFQLAEFYQCAKLSELAIFLLIKSAEQHYEPAFQKLILNITSMRQQLILADLYGRIKKNKRQADNFLLGAYDFDNKQCLDYLAECIKSTLLFANKEASYTLEKIPEFKLLFQLSKLRPSSSIYRRITECYLTTSQTIEAMKYLSKINDFSEDEIKSLFDHAEELFTQEVRSDTNWQQDIVDKTHVLSRIDVALPLFLILAEKNYPDAIQMSTRLIEEKLQYNCLLDDEILKRIIALPAIINQLKSTDLLKLAQMADSYQIAILYFLAQRTADKITTDFDQFTDIFANVFPEIPKKQIFEIITPPKISLLMELSQQGPELLKNQKILQLFKLSQQFPKLLANQIFNNFVASVLIFNNIKKDFTTIIQINLCKQYLENLIKQIAELDNQHQASIEQVSHYFNQQIDNAERQFDLSKLQRVQDTILLVTELIQQRTEEIPDYDTCKLMLDSDIIAKNLSSATLTAMYNNYPQLQMIVLYYARINDDERYIELLTDLFPHIPHPEISQLFTDLTIEKLASFLVSNPWLFNFKMVTTFINRSLMLDNVAERFPTILLQVFKKQVSEFSETFTQKIITVKKATANGNSNLIKLVNDLPKPYRKFVHKSLNNTTFSEDDALTLHMLKLKFLTDCDHISTIINNSAEQVNFTRKQLENLIKEIAKLDNQQALHQASVKQLIHHFSQQINDAALKFDEYALLLLQDTILLVEMHIMQIIEESIPDHETCRLMLRIDVIARNLIPATLTAMYNDYPQLQMIVLYYARAAADESYLKRLNDLFPDIPQAEILQLFNDLTIDNLVSFLLSYPLLFKHKAIPEFISWNLMLHNVTEEFNAILLGPLKRQTAEFSEACTQKIITIKNKIADENSRLTINIVDNKHLKKANILVSNLQKLYRDFVSESLSATTFSEDNAVKLRQLKLDFSTAYDGVSDEIENAVNEANFVRNDLQILIRIIKNQPGFSVNISQDQTSVQRLNHYFNQHIKHAVLDLNLAELRRLQSAILVIKRLILQCTESIPDYEICTLILDIDVIAKKLSPTILTAIYNEHPALQMIILYYALASADQSSVELLVNLSPNIPQAEILQLFNELTIDKLVSFLLSYPQLFNHKAIPKFISWNLKLHNVTKEFNASLLVALKQQTAEFSEEYIQKIIPMKAEIAIEKSNLGAILISNERLNKTDVLLNCLQKLCTLSVNKLLETTTFAADNALKLRKLELEFWSSCDNISKEIEFATKLSRCNEIQEQTYKILQQLKQQKRCDLEWLTNNEKLLDHNSRMLNGTISDYAKSRLDTKATKETINKVFDQLQATYNIFNAATSKTMDTTQKLEIITQAAEKLATVTQHETIEKRRLYANLIIGTLTLVGIGIGLTMGTILAGPIGIALGIMMPLMMGATAIAAVNSCGLFSTKKSAPAKIIPDIDAQPNQQPSLTLQSC